MFHFSFFYSDASSFLYKEIEEKFRYIKSEICKNYKEHVSSFSFYSFKNDDTNLANIFSDICIKYADYDLIFIFNLDYLFISKKDICNMLECTIVKKENLNFPLVFSKWRKGGRKIISQEKSDLFSSTSYINIAESDEYLMKEMYNVFKSSEMNIIHITILSSNRLFLKDEHCVVYNFSKYFIPRNKIIDRNIKSKNITNIYIGQDFEINEIKKEDIYRFIENLVKNNELEEFSHIIIESNSSNYGDDFFSGYIFCPISDVLEKIKL